MKWIVAYDVKTNAARRRVAKRLEQVGFRRQYSVFEGEISVEELTALMDELNTLLVDSSDVITAWPWTENGAAKVIHKGQERTETERDWMLI